MEKQRSKTRCAKEFQQPREARHVLQLMTGGECEPLLLKPLFAPMLVAIHLPTKPQCSVLPGKPTRVTWRSQAYRKGETTVQLIAHWKFGLHGKQKNISRNSSSIFQNHNSCLYNTRSIHGLPVSKLLFSRFFLKFQRLDSGLCIY